MIINGDEKISFLRAPIDVEFQVSVVSPAQVNSRVYKNPLAYDELSYK